MQDKGEGMKKIEVQELDQADHQRNRNVKRASPPLIERGSQKSVQSQHSKVRREPVKMPTSQPLEDDADVPAGSNDHLDVSFPQGQDNGSNRGSKMDPAATQPIQNPEMGLGLPTSSQLGPGALLRPGQPAPNSAGNSPNLPANTSGGADEVFHCMPRMQIKLPPPAEEREPGDLSPMGVETTSHNIMKRKLESEKAQSQDFKHVNVQTSEKPVSSSSALQSTVTKNKMMNFGKNAQHQEGNKSPQTLKMSAQFEEHRPDQIQIGAHNIGNLSELDSFAQQIASHKVVVDESSGIRGFYGEPIIFSTITQQGHCGHCVHFQFVDKTPSATSEIQDIKCTANTCCKENCAIEKTLRKQQEVAFIDYSSSIDHTRELEETYMKYKQVINKLKYDFLLFSQQQPTRKSVVEARPLKSFKPEPVTKMDILTEKIIQSMVKKKSICDGLPENLTGRVRTDLSPADGKKSTKRGQQASQLSMAGPALQQTAKRRSLSVERQSQKLIKKQREARSLSIKRKGGRSYQQGQTRRSKDSSADDENIILLGIDGKVNNFEFQRNHSRFKIDLTKDAKQSKAQDGLDRRTNLKGPKLSLNTNTMQKLQQKSTVQSSKQRAREASARNQDLQTIADFDKQQQNQQNRIHVADINQMQSRPVKYSLVGTQYRTVESNKNLEMNYLQAIKDDSQRVLSPKSTSREQLIQSIQPANGDTKNDKRKIKLPKSTLHVKPIATSQMSKHKPSKSVIPCNNQNAGRRKSQHVELKENKQPGPLGQQRVTTSRDKTKSPAETKSPSELIDPNELDGEQLQYFTMVETQNMSGYNKTYSKEANRLSRDSDKNVTYNDIDKTGTLSDGNELNRQTDRLRAAVQPRGDFILQMEAINHRDNEPRERELEILAPKLQNDLGTFTSEIAKQFIEFPGANGEGTQGPSTGKSITNKHMKRTNMPFNHFVHPSGDKSKEQPASPGRIKLHIKTANKSLADREFGQESSVPGSSVTFKEQPSIFVSTSIGNNHLNHFEQITMAHQKVKAQKSPEIGQLDIDQVQEQQENAGQTQQPNYSRTNSTSRQDPSSSKACHRHVKVSSNERALELGQSMHERFKNRGIADRISKALEKEQQQLAQQQQSQSPKSHKRKQTANSPGGQSEYNIQIQMKTKKIKKKDADEMNSKKVQFRVDMKSRSISRSDSKYFRYESGKRSRMQEQHTVIDPAYLSSERKIGESAARKNNEQQEVALRDLHAKCSQSLNRRDKKQQNVKEAKQKFSEPVALRSKTDFMKKIRIGGKNEALKQLLDQAIRAQSMQQESHPRPTLQTDGEAPEHSSLKSHGDGGGQQVRHVGTDGLEVIFQSNSQSEHFDPQIDRTMKMMRHRHANSPLTFSPATDLYPHQDFEQGYNHNKFDDMLASIHPIGQHDPGTNSGTKLQLQNSVIKRIIKRDKNNDMSPSETFASPEHNLKTMNFDKLDKREDKELNSAGPYQSNLNETLKQKDLQYQRGHAVDAEPTIAAPTMQTKLCKYPANKALNQGSESDYLRQQRGQLQLTKKQTSNWLAGGQSLVQTEERHYKREQMNLDLIDQASRASRRGSDHHMRTNRNITSEAGLENVKFKSIDIQVQSHRPKQRKNYHQLDETNLMSTLDREETIQELLAIEAQLAALLKDPNNISTRKYKRVPKDQLLNTLRQYVFEQSFKNNQAQKESREREHSPFPHDLFEIVGATAKIRKQKQIQRLHNNRMEFIKNIEFLGHTKKHTENKFWQLSPHETISSMLEMKQSQQRSACLDFQEFDKLIKKMDYEQKMIQGKQIEMAKLKGQVLIAKRKQSSIDVTKSYTSSRSNDQDLHNAYSESRTEIFIHPEKVPMHFNNELMQQITQRGFLLHQPKNQMKKYANQHLLTYDHLFLNEEQIIKNNIFNENFYKIRESNKIANHLDMVENKLLDKMKSIKKDEQKKMEKLIKAGELDHDIKIASDIINDKKKLLYLQAPETTAAAPKVKPKKILVKKEISEPKVEEISVNAREPSFQTVPTELNNEGKNSEDKEIIISKTQIKDKETCMISQSQIKSQQLSSKLHVSSISTNKSKYQNDSIQQIQVQQAQNGTQKDSNNNEEIVIKSESKMEQYQNGRKHAEPVLTYEDLSKSMNMNEVKAAPSSKQNTRYAGRDFPTKDAPSAPTMSSLDPNDINQRKQFKERPPNINVEISQVSEDGQIHTFGPKNPMSVKTQQPRAETSQGKMGSIFNRDKLRFESMLDFKNKQRLTRQSVQKAFEDNHILADIKSRFIQKGRQIHSHMAQTRLHTINNSRRSSARNEANYSTIQAGEWQRESFTMNPQTCIQSAHNSIDDENPLTEFKDSMLENSEQAPLNQSLYDSKFVATDAGNQMQIWDKIGLRESIQSQKISERKLQTMKFLNPRQSVNLRPPEGAFSPLIQEGTRLKEPYANATMQGSRNYQRVNISTSQTDAPSSIIDGGRSRYQNRSIQMNQTDYQRSFLPRRKKKEDSNNYLKYVNQKKPLLPALITNQILESKRRHIIQSGLATSVDLSQLRKGSKIGSDYYNTIDTEKGKQKKTRGKVHQSVALSTINHQIENKMDFSQDFKIDSTRLFNHDLQVQRSQRESVTKGFHKVDSRNTPASQNTSEKKYEQTANFPKQHYLDPKYNSPSMSPSGDKSAMYMKMIGSQNDELILQLLGLRSQYPSNPTNRQYVNYETQLLKQKQSQPLDGIATLSSVYRQKPTMNLQESKENSRIALRIMGQQSTDPRLLSSKETQWNNQDEYSLNMTHENPSKQRIAQQSEQELRS